MTDAELDSAYVKAVKANDQARINALASEIVARLTSLWGFTDSIFSASDRFPNYSNLSGFHNAEAAKASLAKSAGHAAGAVAGTVAGVTYPLIALAVVMVAGIYIYKRK